MRSYLTVYPSLALVLSPPLRLQMCLPIQFSQGIYYFIFWFEPQVDEAAGLPFTFQELGCWHSVSLVYINVFLSVSLSMWQNVWTLFECCFLVDACMTEEGISSFYWWLLGIELPLKEQPVLLTTESSPAWRFGLFRRSLNRDIGSSWICYPPLAFIFWSSMLGSSSGLLLVLAWLLITWDRVS